MTAESCLEYITYFTTITQPSHPPYYCFTSGAVILFYFILFLKLVIVPVNTTDISIWLNYLTMHGFPRDPKCELSRWASSWYLTKRGSHHHIGVGAIPFLQAGILRPKRRFPTGRSQKMTHRTLLDPQISAIICRQKVIERMGMEGVGAVSLRRLGRDGGKGGKGCMKLRGWHMGHERGGEYGVEVEGDVA